jgi:transposase InsO family protein
VPRGCGATACGRRLACASAQHRVSLEWLSLALAARGYVVVAQRFRDGAVRRRGPWRSVEDVEFATLEWVAWYNTRRLLEPLGYVSPDDFERAYYNRQTASTKLTVVT